MTSTRRTILKGCRVTCLSTSVGGWIRYSSRGGVVGPRGRVLPPARRWLVGLVHVLVGTNHGWYSSTRTVLERVLVLYSSKYVLRSTV